MFRPASTVENLKLNLRNLKFLHKTKIPSILLGTLEPNCSRLFLSALSP